jgi:hypothetical protein
MKELEDLIFTANDTNFEQIALKVYDFQNTKNDNLC